MNRPIVVLLLFVLATGHFVATQRNPSISFVSKDKVINIGDPLELKCQVQDAEGYPVSWTKLQPQQTFISKGKAIVVPGNRHQLIYNEKDSTYTLLISKVQETDVGLYRCEITTGVNSNVSCNHLPGLTPDDPSPLLSIMPMCQ